MPPSRAAIYTRISLDREGLSLAPERQEMDCRAEIARRGWTEAAVYSDRDVSAYRRGVKRPEFDRLLRDVGAGLIDGIVVWKLDRLTRQGVTGIAPVLDVLAETEAVLLSVTEPWIDTTTPMGRGFLSTLAAQAEQSSADTSLRVARAHRAAAVKGDMHGGGSRSYGYDRDGSVIEEEAAVIREAVTRVLTGESLRQIAFDLNRRGVKTSTGKEWRSVTLGSVLRRPKLAGLRTHNGDVYQGTWEPILSREEHNDLLAALSRPLSTRRSVNRHLLTGLAVCGLCGGALKTMGFRMSNGKPFERYQCVRQPGEVNCGRVAVAKNSLDVYVSGEVLDFLGRAKLRPSDEQVTEVELEERVAEDGQALRELTDARFVHRTVRPDDYEHARRRLDDNLAANTQALEALRRRREERYTAIRLGDRAGLGRWWEAAGTEEKRDAVASALMSVRIDPAQRRGGNRFDTGRVVLTWRWDLFLRAADRFEETATEEDRDSASRDYAALRHAAGLDPD